MGQNESKHSTLQTQVCRLAKLACSWGKWQENWTPPGLMLDFG